MMIKAIQPDCPADTQVAASPPSAPEQTDTLVARAVGLIQSRLGQLPPIEELAASVDVDRSTLHRHFRRALGMSVRGAIREIRLTEARRLLAETELPITHVALAAGYSSPAKMADHFRMLLRVTPSQFRRRAKGEREMPQ
ncbi:MAG: AraC family transcriptional regulator [Planctomycetia bacterium]|nr:AraC family transcriptional regulator [Planctomycetia bacterium]